jgi:hypothetical protein
MPQPSQRPRIDVGQALVAGVLVLWRIVAVPGATLWRDWLLIVAAYWLILSLRPRAALNTTLVLTLIAYLLGIYVVGQAPHTLASLVWK